MAGCDLQPKIASIPDSVGDFISARYPTLLAEPDSEIYKTAVADYGVYASPAVYGNGDVTSADYVLYSPADDYLMPAQDTDVPDDDVGMPDEEETDDDTDTENQDIENTPDDAIDDLTVPDYVNEKPVQKVQEKAVAEPVKEPKETVSDAKQPETQEMLMAPIREITIEKGDTLYSVSRKYSVPVNDLAVMNKISAPFALSVGQKLKVPDILSVPKYDAKPERAATNTAKSVKPVESTEQVTTPVATKKPQVDKTVQKTENKTTVTENKQKPADTKTTSTTDKNKSVKADDQSKKTDAKKEVKPQAKKTEVKKEIKKAEPKKTDTKKAVTNKKTEAKKTDVKNTSQKSVQKSTTKADTQKRTVKQLAARSSSKFSWPVRGKILSGYGSKTNGLFNDGINIKAARGTTVLAAENGFVAYAGNEVKGMGNLVIIQHADGWMTVYAHMDSMTVRRGSTVLVGQKIGTVGTSGKVDQPQLHFEIRKGTKAYNPVNYLKK